MPTPGRLDERISIEQQGHTDDGLGGRTVAWTALGSAWAQVTPLQGRESEARGGVVATQTYRVTVRNRSDVDESMRVQWRGRTMNIRRIEWPGPRDLYLNIIVEQGVPDGR